MKRILVLATNTGDAKILLWCLREAGHESYVAGNISKNAELEYSPLCAKFYCIPEEWTIEGRSQEIIGYIKLIIRDNSIDIILPTGFESIKYLSAFNEKLKQFVRVAPVPPLETIDRLGNKFEFANLCKASDIPHPQTYLLENIDAVKNGNLPVRFPLMTKPINMSASRGIFKFENGEELIRYLAMETEDKSNVLPLLLQEFIPGNDIDLNGFAQNGHLSAWTIQQFIEIPRRNNAPLRWIQFLKNDDILEIGKKIIGRTKYSGPIHVDLRIDERDQKVVSIEVNPRFWASTFASLCDGVNFADVAVQSAFDPDYTKKPKYSNRIWGTPHRIPLLLLSERKAKFILYGSQHTILQVKFRILDKIFSMIAERRRNKASQHIKSGKTGKVAQMEIK